MYRVLLVDDESLTLDYLKMAIPKQDPDWEIAGACLDGIQALEWFESHSADLVLTDIKMPEMSGLELCERLHRRNPEQKIVILSGHDEFKFATCKSYLTQKKGELTDEEEQILAKTPLVFGCDVCQEVCPHNKDIPTTPIPEFQQIEPYINIDELETLTNKEFKAKYGHRAFSWRGKKILMRNQEIIDRKNKL